jgi:multiple sugar transport system substrate-binding protein/putative aldouronate transport system substrate-binding protein
MDMVMMVKATGALYGYDEIGLGLYDTKTQTFEPCLQEGGMYLRSLRFYNQLFQRGLIDPDSMTQTLDDMTEKYVNGRAMFNIFSWMAATFNTEDNMAAGKAMMCVAAEDQKNLVYGLNVFGNNRLWTIGAQTAYPRLCMEIINWFSTPDGVLAYNYGPKGVTWDYDDEGNTYQTELGLSAQQDGENTMMEYLSYSGSYKDGEFQHNNTTWNAFSVNPESALGEKFSYETWRSTLLNKTVYPIEHSWRDYMGAVRADDYLISRGHVSVSIGSTFSLGRRGRELNTTWNQVRECIKAGSWDAIYAESNEGFNAVVDKMIDNAKAYGYDECIEWTKEQAALRKEAEDRTKG